MDTDQEESDLQLDEDDMDTDGPSDEDYSSAKPSQSMVSEATYSPEKVTQSSYNQDNSSEESFEQDQQSDQNRPISSSFSEPSDMLCSLQNSNSFYDQTNDSDNLPNTHPYNTQYQNAGPSDSQHNFSPIHNPPLLAPSSVPRSPTNSQYNYRRGQDRSLNIQSLDQIPFVSNTNPSDTSLDSNNISKRHELPDTLSLPNINRLLTNQHYDADPKDVSDYYHYPKYTDKHMNDENQPTDSFEHTQAYEYNMDEEDPNEHTSHQEPHITKRTQSPLTDKPDYNENFEHPRNEGYINSKHQEFSRSNQSLITGKELFDYLSQVADAIAEKIVVRQENEQQRHQQRGPSDLESLPFDITPISNSVYHDSRRDRSRAEIPIPYLPVNESISANTARYDKSSFPDKYHYEQNVHDQYTEEEEEEEDTENNTDIDETDAADDANTGMNYEDEFHNLEDYILQIPQGATILKYFYQHKKYDKEVDVQDLVKDVNTDTNGEPLAKSSPAEAAYQEPFIFDKSYTSKVSRTVSLPVRKSNFLMSKRAEARSMGSPVRLSSTPSVFSEPRKASVSFAAKTQFIPHRPAYSSNETLSTTTIHEHAEPNQFLEPNRILGRATRSDYFPMRKKFETQSSDRTMASRLKTIDNPIGIGATHLADISTGPHHHDGNYTPSPGPDSVSQSSPHTPPTMPSMDDVSDLEVKLRELQTQTMAMADELHTRDVAHTDLLSEISLLRAAKESLEAENQKLTQHVEDLNQDLKDAYLKIDSIKGAAKPLSKDRMPDAHSTRIPETRKIYFRFEMTDVDKLGQTEAQNIIKNVCLQTGTRFSNLEKRLAKLVKAKQNEQVYTNFANDVHRVLYKKDMQCWPKRKHVKQGQTKHAFKENDEHYAELRRDYEANDSVDRRRDRNEEPDQVSKKQERCLFEMITVLRRMEKEQRNNVFNALMDNGNNV